MNFSLSLENFRRFQTLELSFDGPTVIIGQNGTGKSTLLEAVVYLSVARSYRTIHDRELVHWDEHVGRTRITFDDLQVERVIALTGQSVTKRSFVNEVRQPTLLSIGQFYTVLFSPEQIDLITGSPRVRRRFLDTVLSAVDPVYARTLAEYGQVLRQRNELLQRPVLIADHFLPWEATIAQLGARILEKRRVFIDFVATLLNQEYQAIAPTGSQRTISVQYASGIQDEPSYQTQLAARRQRDHAARATTLGPHRDDLLLLIDGFPAAIATSRGEQRSILIALKQTERQFFAAKVADQPPLLLLDDVFSELDEARSNRLGALVADAPAIITTAEPRTIPRVLRDRATSLAIDALVPVA